METAPGLQDLPQEILVKVLSYCHHSELLLYRDVSRRFQYLCSSPVLWRKVIFPGATNLSTLKSCLPLLSSSTTEFKVNGFLCQQPRIQLKTNLSKDFLKKLEKNCPNLKVLALERCFIQGKDVCVKDLPSRVEHLSLEGCEVVDPDLFLGVSPHGSNPLRKAYFKSAVPLVVSLNLSRTRCFNHLHLYSMLTPHNLTSLTFTHGRVDDTRFVEVEKLTATSRLRLESVDLTGTDGGCGNLSRWLSRISANLQIKL